MPSKFKTFCVFCFVVFVSFFVGLHVSYSKEDGKDYWPTKEWKVSSPEEQAVDSKKLEEMNKYVLEKCPNVTSLLLVRNGYIVFEKYYQGDKESEHSVYSATKSVVSALIGIALNKGYIKNIDQKMYEFFPEFASDITDSRRREISIRDLLTMSAGFGPKMTGGDMKTCFSLSIVYDPGTNAAYNSCETHLLSGIITKTTKMNSFKFGTQFLFKPLGINAFSWGIPSAEYTFGGYGLNMRSRDMAKIGYLYLKDGVWEGKQVVPKEWVKESTKKQIDIPSLERKKLPYGYQWWITSPGGHPGFCAVGIGGQYIHVVPDLNIVMVATSNTMHMHPAHKVLIKQFIVPAMVK